MDRHTYLSECRFVSIVMTLIWFHWRGRGWVNRDEESNVDDDDDDVDDDDDDAAVVAVAVVVVAGTSEDVWVKVGVKLATVGRYGKLNT